MLKIPDTIIAGHKVETIIVRNKPIRPSEVRMYAIKMTCALQSESDEGPPTPNISASEFVRSYGHEEILDVLYEDPIETPILEESSLYHNYLRTFETALASQEKNIEKREVSDDFVLMYKISDRHAVHIDANVNLFGLVRKDEGWANTVPWHYASQGRYLAMTAWRQDEELLNQIFNVS